ncbi:unnamed protein product [Didymodactylos carnosus]|uniref:Uncharacterized protein n=1 Tax=Didymodactylos carnosus TaxID=1234261 RepID=A0A815MVK1_9BILA|nr:unnamed protein product [Didymodactylos carnosus]CAF1449995.1 unnamed protein product [Didymodactylos carnosus]CAF4244857.1 unnamed protein product [Didymodactylos carnosus]CAF4306863.1 unnamed protein product [Didymodactylos carnosus]
MATSTQLQCGGRTCPECGKCSDWVPNYGKKYKRRDDGTCRDNTDTLYDALFRAGLAVADARPSARKSIRMPHNLATDRCRRAVDDVNAAFNAAIVDDDLRDLVIEGLSCAEMVAYDIDRACDEDGRTILRACKAVRNAQDNHVCHCKEMAGKEDTNHSDSLN